MRRAEAGVRTAAAGDQDLIAGGSALHVPAEVVAEHVRADRVWLRLGRRVGGVELMGRFSNPELILRLQAALSLA